MTIKIDHVNLSVANIKESIEWYGKVFGFQLVESGVTPLGRSWGIVSCRDFSICMVEYPGRESADKFSPKGFYHINHFGIRISDRNLWEETIKTHGIKVNYGGEVEYPHSKSWYVLDPSGHEIEVSHSEKGKMFPEL